MQLHFVGYGHRVAGVARVRASPIPGSVTAAEEVQDGFQGGDGAADGDEEEFGRHPCEDVVGGPGKVGPVGELGEVGCLDAGADGGPAITVSYLLAP